MTHPIENQLTQFLAEVMEMDATQVSPTLSFGEQGMDSLNGMRFARKIQDFLGQDIELEWLFDYPSIRQLARFLEQQLHTHGEEVLT